ncbi:PEP-utilizing enzyme [Variovorax humicola]|uniref:PEP-utilizing enzyme n=1 Tax=Variovorax humicola TaxID=1769758 RepID=UPI003BF55A65
MLIADTTTPDWGPVMKIASAVVNNRGGGTCHAAIVARELGIPAVVGCDGATAMILTGEQITVHCAGGAEGHVYPGAVPFDKESVNLSALARPQTYLMVNLGNPDLALQIALLPHDGVGLARMEFIVTGHIRIHPMALVHPEKMGRPAQRAEIARLTRGFDRPADYFVRQPSEGVGAIAAAFHPKPVIVRMSDFKSNEYVRLRGGGAFESPEENPMNGFRGASRYTRPAYADGFALECAAMKRGARRHGIRQRQAHDSLLPPHSRGREGARGGGRPRAAPRRKRPGDLRDVRDPEQRDPDRRVRAPVRRFFDRVERPHNWSWGSITTRASWRSTSMSVTRA